MDISNYQDLVSHVTNQYPKEAAGYIKDGVFYPVDNIADEPEHNFKLPGSVMLQEPDAIVHSHCIPLEPIDWEPNEPSLADQEGQLTTGVEWGIIPTDGENCSPIVWWGNPEHRPELLGRDFIHCAQDCLSLCRDYLYNEHRILVPSMPRRPDWWLRGENLMDEHYKEWGFVDVPREEARPGDVAFFAFRGNITNHLGIYMGDGLLMHHFYLKPSVIEPIGPYMKNFVRFARHQELLDKH